MHLCMRMAGKSHQNAIFRTQLLNVCMAKCLFSFCYTTSENGYKRFIQAAVCLGFELDEVFFGFSSPAILHTMRPLFTLHDVIGTNYAVIKVIVHVIAQTIKHRLKFSNCYSANIPNGFMFIIIIRELIAWKLFTLQIQLSVTCRFVFIGPYLIIELHIAYIKYWAINITFRNESPEKSFDTFQTFHPLLIEFSFFFTFIFDCYHWLFFRDNGCG